MQIVYGVTRSRSARPSRDSRKRTREGVTESKEESRRGIGIEEEATKSI